MRRLIGSAFAVLALVTAAGTSAGTNHAASGIRATASCRGAVSWQNARRYVGRYATIKGRVAGTKYAASSNGSPTFLDLGADYPSLRRVTVVIWFENRARFGAPERRYRGHTICVRGFVHTYGGVPEIETASPSQIAVAR